MIRGIVFDFDGVLADTEPLHFAAFHEVFAAHGWNLSRDTYVTDYLGHGDRTVVDEFSRAHFAALTAEQQDQLFREKSAAFRRRLANGDAIYPAASACVRRLQPHFPLAVASGALRAEIVDILTASGLIDAFTTIVSIENVARGKPAPDPYLLAAERLGLPPAACLAIEDAPWGLDSARAAGLFAIGIPNTAAESALRSAHRIIQSLDELTLDSIRAIGPGIDGPRSSS